MADEEKFLFADDTFAKIDTTTLDCLCRMILISAGCGGDTKVNKHVQLLD